MQRIIKQIRLNDLAEPIKCLANERSTIDNENNILISNSIYREILFLACKVLGRASIDINTFDKEYTTAYYRLTERNKLQYGPQDKPISLNALYCRQYFRPLSLP